MGIHYDYKSTRGEKAMKKEAKRKARIEERRAKKGGNLKHQEKEKMHDIDKPITLEDLTNPDKKQFKMSSLIKKDSRLERREKALKKNLNKRKKFKIKKKKKHDCTL